MSQQPPEWPSNSPQDPGQQPPSWGQMPPPPPAYGAPPGGQPYSVGNAISYGWKKFTENAGPFIAIALLWGVTYVGISLIGNIVSGGGAAVGDATDSSAFDIGSSLVSLLFNLLAFVASSLFAAAAARGALDVVEGHPVSVGAMFQRWDKAQVVIAAVLVSILTFLGIIAFCVGIFVVAFLLYFTPWFVVGAGQQATDAIKSSFNFTKSHVGELLPLALVNVAITIVGACLCGVGLLVAYPVTILASAYAFRTLHGQPVAP